VAGQFNDEQLRRQALKLTDPYDQSNLVWTVPDGAELLDITNIYVFERYPREKVFCVECGGHHHKRGFTAMLTSGQRVLLGSTCGARLFAESWADAEKRIEERADRQFELKKLDRFALISGPLESGLIGWKSPLEQISWRRAAFDKTLGELASRVREAANARAGALTVFRKVQSNAARQAGMKSLGNELHQEVTVGQIVGIEFLASLDPAKAIGRAIDAFYVLKGSVSKTDNSTTKMLRDRRRGFERALEDVETSAKIHAGAEAFYTRSNFAEMVRWANEHGATQARYDLDANDVVRREGSAGGIQISLPPPIDTVLLDLIADYRRAD
jgi:hypothetical protein